MQVEGKMPADPIVIMEMLSEEYGWTPDQILAVPMEIIDAYVRIIKIRRTLQKNMRQ